MNTFFKRNRIAILFVPFAMLGGKPKKIRMGNVNKEPPPAIVFIDPATKPIKIKTTISNPESI